MHWKTTGWRAAALLGLAGTFALACSNDDTNSGTSVAVDSASAFAVASVVTGEAIDFNVLLHTREDNSPNTITCTPDSVAIAQDCGLYLFGDHASAVLTYRDGSGNAQLRYDSLTTRSRSVTATITAFTGGLPEESRLETTGGSVGTISLSATRPNAQASWSWEGSRHDSLIVSSGNHVWDVVLTATMHAVLDADLNRGIDTTHLYPGGGTMDWQGTVSSLQSTAPAAVAANITMDGTPTPTLHVGRFAYLVSFYSSDLTPLP